MNVYRLLNLRSGHGPHDLRDYVPNSGKVYPVDPAAVEQYKRIMAEREAAEQRSMKLVAIRRRKNLMTKTDPTQFYTPEIVAAAAVERDKAPVQRRYENVFTPEVVAVWERWLDEGRSVQWIATHNGLIPTSMQTVQNYLAKHGTPKTAVSPTPQPVETAVSPKPKTATADRSSSIIRTETAVPLKQVRDLGEMIQSIAALDGVSVRGTVRIELEVEFNS